MKFLILGAGGIGSYFGTRLITAGHDVVFVARGAHLEALQQKKLVLQHPEFSFNKTVISFTFDELKSFNTCDYDAVIITTKATSTSNITKDLKDWFSKYEHTPYIISLQNGVENEEILEKDLDSKYIIAGLTRKIGAHIVKPAVIEAKGRAEAILGAIDKTKENQEFLKVLKDIFEKAEIPTFLPNNIKLELWKKLIINNGVNGICALLKEETGLVMNHKKLSKIVYGLMGETVVAAKAKGLNISQKELDEMYDLITNFDSIKPSMLVDLENKRPLELEEICNVVVRNCELQGFDAPYTRTISTILEHIYNQQFKNI